MQTSTVLITPSKAKKLLEQNINNRPLKQPHVDFLVSELEHGNWKLNGESIKIAKDKTILDGQHRLSAVVKSKKSMKTVVMTGLDSEVFDTIDTGKNRSPGDTFALMGEKNCNALAAMIKSLHRYYDLDWKKAYHVSNSEFEKLLERFPDARQVVRMGELKAPGLIPARCLHLAFYVFKRKNKEQALEFMTKLCNGSDLAARSPIMALRNKIMEGKLKGLNMHPDLIISLIFKTWNMYRDGKQTTRLNFKKGDALQRAR